MYRGFKTEEIFKGWNLGCFINLPVQTFRSNKSLIYLSKQYLSYERLFGHPTSYKHLKSFGCQCYATTSKPGKDKFYFRFVPVIFIGYPCGKKAYKLLNLSSHSIFYLNMLFSKSIYFFTYLLHKFPLISHLLLLLLTYLLLKIPFLFNLCQLFHHNLLFPLLFSLFTHLI